MSATTITDIRKKAKKGIDKADDTTVKMILAMPEVQEQENEEETTFEKELLRRFDDYEQGKVKTYTYDELTANARNAFAEHKKSNM
jgi:putative addiction module component (TIGR02574 family)